MLRKSNGVTLITLVITIIVILILTSIFVATGMNALKEARKSEIQAEIGSLQEAISIRFTSYLKNGESVDLVGISPTSIEKLSDASKCINAIKNSVGINSDKEAKITREIVSHFDEYVKIVTPYEASILGVEPIKEDSIYIVDYYTSAVYGPILTDYLE